MLEGIFTYQTVLRDTARVHLNLGFARVDLGRRSWRYFQTIEKLVRLGTTFLVAVQSTWTITAAVLGLVVAYKNRKKFSPDQEKKIERLFRKLGVITYGGVWLCVAYHISPIISPTAFHLTSTLGMIRGRPRPVPT